MRKLTGQDTFLIMPIIGKLDLIPAIKESYNNVSRELKGKDLEGDELNQAIGIEVFVTIIDTIMVNAYKAQDDINKLIGAVTGLTQKQVKELSFEEYNETLFKILNQEEFINFFKLLI